MLGMREIHNLFKDLLLGMGYSASCRKQTIDFSLPDTNCRGEFSIACANAKRFELSVYGAESNFKIPCRRSDIDRPGMFGATKRFSRRADAIPSAVEWVATCVTQHEHLYDILHPEIDAPEALHFRDEEFVSFDEKLYGGSIISIRVDEVVALEGRRVIRGVQRPGSKPYFLVTAETRPFSSGCKFITDGEAWLPILDLRPEDYRVFFNSRTTEKLSAMNQRDRVLIYEAVRRYVNAHIVD